VGVGVATPLTPWTFEFDVARSSGCDVQRLRWERVDELIDFSIGWTLRDIRQRGRISTFESHLLHAKQRDVIASTRNVSRYSIEHIGQQSRRKYGLLCFQRI